MGSGQSNNKTLEPQLSQPIIKTSLSTLNYQSQNNFKKRNIVEDDDDDDDDEEDDDLESNEESDDEGQNSSIIQEYIEGEMYLGNKIFFPALILHSNQLFTIRKVFLPKTENYKLIKFSLQQLFNLQNQNVNDIKSWNLEQVSGQKKGYMAEIFSCFQINGSLQQFIQKYCKFTFDLALYILKQILLGLKYLQGQNILHKNLKTSNILISEQGNILLSDILIFSSLHQSNYSAPETLLYQEFSESSDIWSVGCIFYEILTKKQPWQFESRELSISEIKKSISNNQIFLRENEIHNSEAFLLLTQILQFNPQNRPTLEQLLNHKIFSETSQSKLQMATKQLQLKGDQKKVIEKNIKNLMQNIQAKNNNQQPQHRKEFTKFKLKENQEVTETLIQTVKQINEKVFLEFTEKQNSKQYNLTKSNFTSLCQKQVNFASNSIKKLQELTKLNLQIIENLPQLSSQVQTAVNFQGINQDSDLSVNGKQYDNQSCIFNANQFSNFKFSEQNQDVGKQEYLHKNNIQGENLKHEQTQQETKQETKYETKQETKTKQSNVDSIQRKINFNDTKTDEKIIFDGDLLFIL